MLLTEQSTIDWICSVSFEEIVEPISISTPKDHNGNGSTIGVIAKCCGIIVDMFNRTTIPRPVAADVG